MKKVLMTGVTLCALTAATATHAKTLEEWYGIADKQIEEQKRQLKQQQAREAEQKEQYEEQLRQEVNSPNFRQRPNLVLVCEAMTQDRAHITVQIVPSEGIVRIGNDTLSITKAMMSRTSARNEFGHEVVVPYIAFVWANRFMFNNVDKAGAIIGGSGTINYGNGLFKCIG